MKKWIFTLPVYSALMLIHSCGSLPLSIADPAYVYSKHNTPPPDKMDKAVAGLQKLVDDQANGAGFRLIFSSILGSLEMGGMFLFFGLAANGNPSIDPVSSYYIWAGTLSGLSLLSITGIILDIIFLGRLFKAHHETLATWKTPEVDSPTTALSLAPLIGVDAGGRGLNLGLALRF